MSDSCSWFITLIWYSQNCVAYTWHTFQSCKLELAEIWGRISWWWNSQSKTLVMVIEGLLPKDGRNYSVLTGGWWGTSWGSWRTLLPVCPGPNFYTKSCDVGRAFFLMRNSLFAVLSTTVFLAVVIKTLISFYLNGFQNCWQIFSFLKNLGLLSQFFFSFLGFFCWSIKVSVMILKTFLDKNSFKKKKKHMFLENGSMLGLVKLKKKKKLLNFSQDIFPLFLTSFANFEVTVSFARTIQIMWLFLK